MNLKKGGNTWEEKDRASECPSYGVQNADFSCRALGGVQQPGRVPSSPRNTDSAFCTARPGRAGAGGGGAAVSGRTSDDSGPPAAQST